MGSQGLGDDRGETLIGLLHCQVDAPGHTKEYEAPQAGKVEACNQDALQP